MHELESLRPKPSSSFWINKRILQYSVRLIYMGIYIYWYLPVNSKSYLTVGACEMQLRAKSGRR